MVGNGFFVPNAGGTVGGYVPTRMQPIAPLTTTPIIILWRDSRDSHPQQGFILTMTSILVSGTTSIEMHNPEVLPTAVILPVAEDALPLLRLGAHPTKTHGVVVFPTTYRGPTCPHNGSQGSIMHLGVAPLKIQVGAGAALGPHPGPIGLFRIVGPLPFHVIALHSTTGDCPY